IPPAPRIQLHLRRAGTRRRDVVLSKRCLSFAAEESGSSLKLRARRDVSLNRQRCSKGNVITSMTKFCRCCCLTSLMMMLAPALRAQDEAPPAKETGLKTKGALMDYGPFLSSSL